MWYMINVCDLIGHDILFYFLSIDFVFWHEIRNIGSHINFFCFFVLVQLYILKNDIK